MKIKKTITALALVFVIVMASFLPVPITFYSKDNLPKYLIEMVDKKEDEDDQSETKESFLINPHVSIVF